MPGGTRRRDRVMTPDLRRRLSRIARGIGSTASTPLLPGTATAAGVGTESAAERQPEAPEAPEAAILFLDYDPRACGTEAAGEWGPSWHVEPDLGQLLPDAPLRGQRCGEGPVLFLDIETAGLSAAPLFLIGTLRVEAGRLVLTQLLARDYTEEAAILHAFSERAAEFQEWVTFNGRTFDEPYVRDRAAFHRVRVPVPERHVDLLPVARRRWKNRFGDCRLATLERHVCGRRRLGDVAGEAIPGLYHEFVRTANWPLLAPILHHNAMDLLSMAELRVELG